MHQWKRWLCSYEGEWSNHDVNISLEQPSSSDRLVSILERIKIGNLIEDKRLKASHDAFRSLLKESIIRHVYNLLLHEFDIQSK